MKAIYMGLIPKKKCKGGRTEHISKKLMFKCVLSYVLLIEKLGKTSG